MLSSGVNEGWVVVSPLIWVMPGAIVGQGNLPHKGANCMPVPRDGFFTSNTGDFAVKSVFSENTRTIMDLYIARQIHFGASMIGRTITG
jgi:hypothetical protein